MCVSVNRYICPYVSAGTGQGQKKLIRSSYLALQMVVNYYTWMLGNEVGFSAKEENTLNHFSLKT